MKNYVLLNNEKTEILNNIHIQHEGVGVTIVAENPANLIELNEFEYWDFQTKSTLKLPQAQIDIHLAMRAEHEAKLKKQQAEVPQSIG
jgi:hypothetical protein